MLNDDSIEQNRELDVLTLDPDDLLDNPAPRVPVVLCLDTSGSMGGQPILELQEGVDTFYQALRDDEVAVSSAEVSVVKFGGSVEVLQGFGRVDTLTPPSLHAGGGTPMGEALMRGLDELDGRKTMYRNAGIDYYQPWLVVMTDGAPTDDISEACQRITGLVEAKRLTVFPVGIGHGANMNMLGMLSPGRPPLALKGLRFRDFFAWLSQSVARVSQSTPGQRVPLNTKGIAAWAEV